MPEATNKVLFGISNLHYALLDEAAGTYQTPVPVPGTVNLSADPEGDKSEFYADNIPYFVVTANNGYSGEIELAKFTDEMLVDLLGYEIDQNGMVVEISDALAKPFALLGEINGDVKKRRFVFYSARLERPKNDHATSEKSITPKTQSASITMLPVEIGGKKIVRAALEPTAANTAVYEAFYTSVTTPTWAAG